MDCTRSREGTLFLEVEERMDIRFGHAYGLPMSWETLNPPQVVIQPVVGTAAAGANERLRGSRYLSNSEQGSLSTRKCERSSQNHEELWRLGRNTPKYAKMGLGTQDRSGSRRESSERYWDEFYFV